MKTKILALFAFAMLFSAYSNAQRVSGRVYEVVEGKELPLIGANLQWLGTTRGTSTDLDGEFTINHTSASNYLIVSFIGYNTDTIEYTGQKELNIELTSGEYLNEVAVAARKEATSLDRMSTLQVENISGDELCKAACCNLSSSFETNASVDAAYSDAATGAKQIRLLGLSGRYVQLMTENFPNYYGLSTAFGLEYIPGPWMEAIQVSKGTSSVINGYEAITGQINIEYKKPKTSEPIYLNWFINDKGRTEINFNARYNINKHLSTMIITHHGWSMLQKDVNKDNFMDHPMVNRHFLFGRLDYKKDGFMSRLGLKYITEDRTGGQLTFDPKLDYRDQESYGIQIKTNRFEGFWKNGYVLPSDKNTSIALINNVSYHDHQGLYGHNQYNANQLSYYGNLLWQSVIANEDHSYTTGLSLKYDKFDENLNLTQLNKEEIVPGAYFQYSMNLDNGLSAILGVRADHHNTFGTFVTPRVHFKYKPNGITVFRASAGKGWRTANILAENTYLLASSREMIIDNDIRPEEAWNLGASVTQYFMVGVQEWRITAEYFRTWFENQLIVDIDSDVRKVHYSNLDGKSYSNTYQIELSAPILAGLDMRTAFRYNDVKQTINGQLLEVPLTSRSKGFITASYKTGLEKWQFDLTAQINGGGRIPSTAANPEAYLQRGEKFDPYPMLHAQITRYFKTWSIYVGMENILDYRQQNPIIDAANPFGEYFDAGMIWGPLEGRKVYLGLRWELKNLKK